VKFGGFEHLDDRGIGPHAFCEARLVLIERDDRAGEC
jgi:hypothetical protein